MTELCSDGILLTLDTNVIIGFSKLLIITVNYTTDKCQNIDQDRPKPSTMDFDSMMSVQDIKIALQRFYVGFSAETSKPLNERISQLEIENKEKDREIANLKNRLSEKQKSGNKEEGLYDFRYDVTDFQEGVCADDVDSFFEKLIQLTEVRNIDDSYIVDTGIAIVPVYKIITESVKFKDSNWHYLGSLKNFCNYWNINVVGNIKDETRKESLLCNYDSVKAELNRAPWKGYGPASWKMSSADKNCKTAIKRAINIKVRMEQIFF